MSSLVAKILRHYLVSGSRTTTQTSGDISSPHHRGVRLITTASAIGTGSITPKIQEKDPVTGVYADVLVDAAIATNITSELHVFPGSAVTTNVSANAYLPRVWRIVVTANNANPAVYKVDYQLLP